MRQTVLNIVGAVMLIVGAIGIVVPILPTTPFVIVASICFVGNSKVYLWLMKNKYFATYINNYRKKTGVDLATKIKSILFIYISISISIFFVHIMWLQIMLAIITITVACHIALLRNKESKLLKLKKLK